MYSMAVWDWMGWSDGSWSGGQRDYMDPAAFSMVPLGERSLAANPV